MADKRGPRVTVTLSPAVHTRLETECHRRVVSPSLMIERAVERFLDELPPLDPALQREASAKARKVDKATRKR